MEEVGNLLQQWGLDLAQVRERIYRAAEPRERERWHALWLLGLGWTATRVAETLEREPHTIGHWVESFREHGPSGLAFHQTGGPPPPCRPSSRPN